MLCLGVRPSYAEYLEDVGYSALKAALGTQLPRGEAVRVDQIEASVDPDVAIYLPNPADPQLVGVSFHDHSAGLPTGFSGHATGMARILVGETTSMAPAVTDLDNYEANDWLARVLGYHGIDDPSRPIQGTGTVANHSWIGDLASETGLGPAANVLALQRLDWLVHADDFVNVAGSNKTSPIFSHAFNVISVRPTSTRATIGTLQLDDIYVEGRANPLLVAPLHTTSAATALVSSAVVFLQDTVAPTGVPSEVIKAALLAGARRAVANSDGSAISDYRAAPEHFTANGLDRRYGAGQVDIETSHALVAAGPQSSLEDGGHDIGPIGYHYDAQFGGGAGSNRIATYAFTTGINVDRFTAALVWHLNVEDGQGAFDPAPELYDLNLFLIDATDGTEITIAESASMIDNTEHIHVEVGAQRRYELRVTSDAPPFDWDYAVAWRLTTKVPSVASENIDVMSKALFVLCTLVLLASAWWRYFARKSA